MHRRLFLATILAAPMARAETFALSDAEWRARLSDLSYRVLREEETERPHTSPLNMENRQGTYHCAGCDLAAFSSDTKYDSGTGWPSFWKPLPDAIATARTAAFSVPGPKSTAAAAKATSATCSRTAPHPPACATA